MGTRFVATPEAPALPAHKQAIVDARPGATVRTGIWDLIWGREWPGVEVRTIRNAVADRWIGREAEIPAVRDEIKAGIARAARDGDGAEIDLMAGVGAARIRSVSPAADLVRAIAADADRDAGGRDADETPGGQ